MTRKDHIIGYLIFIDVLVVLTYGLSNSEDLMTFLKHRPEVAFVFWMALLPLIGLVILSYGQWVLKALNKKA